LWFTAFLACASGEKVCLIKINGAIGPATASYISRSIGEAQSQNAQCLIIQLNTPGRLLDSTQVIVQKLLASPVPVVYVAPIGATATSAGCFITLATTARNPTTR
jgi:membrane-bound serine protease (ClpP class)